MIVFIIKCQLCETEKCLISLSFVNKKEEKLVEVEVLKKFALSQSKDINLRKSSSPKK